VLDKPVMIPATNIMTQTTYTVEVNSRKESYAAKNSTRARRKARSENPEAIIGEVDKL